MAVAQAIFDHVIRQATEQFIFRLAGIAAVEHVADDRIRRVIHRLATLIRRWRIPWTEILWQWWNDDVLPVVVHETVLNDHGSFSEDIPTFVVGDGSLSFLSIICY